MKKTPAHTVAVVVPFRDSMPALDPSARSIVAAAEACGDACVVFVDNGSTDGSRDFLLDTFGDSIRVEGPASGVVSKMRNIGVSTTDSEFISFIDSDCVIAPDYLPTAIACLAEGQATAIGSRYILPEDPHWVEAVWDRMHSTDEKGPTTYINGGNLFCLRSGVEAIGGFDEDLETGEDAEFCQRLRKAGMTVFNDPRVQAVHLGNPKSLMHMYRKQRWHGLGALGTFRADRFDRPLIMTVAFGVLAVLGVALVVAGFGPAPLLLPLLPPIATVAYRARASGTVPPIVRGVILYTVYYAARLDSLFRIAIRSIR